MNLDLYDDKCPRWLTTGQIPPATLWAEHFNRSAKKRNPIYTKYLEQRLAVCRTKYGMLNPDQIFGMALRELKVPSCGFKINQNFLNNNKKNTQQSKGNSKSKRFQSRSYCLFEDAEPSSDEVTLDNFHHRHQSFGAPSPPTSFLQNDDIYSDLSEMFEEVEIQPFKSLPRKTRPSDISTITKRKHIKSPKDNRLLNQFEKFKEMANCDSEISSYYETRRENPEVSKSATPLVNVISSKSKAPAVNVVNQSSVPVPAVNVVNQSSVPVPVVNVVNKSILKSNTSRENISKISNFEKSVQFNENLEEVREYQIFEDSSDDEVSTIENNSLDESGWNVSAQISKTMSDSILNGSSSIMDIEMREIIASTPLPVEEEQVKHNETEQQLQIIENQRKENSFTSDRPTSTQSAENETIEEATMDIEMREIIASTPLPVEEEQVKHNETEQQLQIIENQRQENSFSTSDRPTSTQSVENETIEEATICESSLFEISQTEECSPVSPHSQNSLDESVIYNSFEDSNRTTTNISLKKNSKEKLKNGNRETISIQKSDIFHNSLKSNTISYEQDIEVMDEQHSPIQVSGEKEVQDSYLENSLINSFESDGNEGIEESNVIFNYVDLNEQDRRDIDLRQRHETSQNSYISVDFEGEIQSKETLIKDDRDLNTANQNNQSSNLDQSVEKAERAEYSSNNELGNGEIEASSKVAFEINKQIRCDRKGKLKCTISQHSNTSPEIKVTGCRGANLDSIQNEEFPMEKESIDLDIVNQNNLTKNLEDIEIHNNIGVTTAAITIEEEEYGEYDEIESLCQSDKKKNKRKHLNFDSVRVPFWVADENVALFEEMDQLQVEVEKEQVDLSTTNKINLSTILEDTEIHDNMRFPTAASPKKEDMKGDERNKKVKKLRKELNFDSVRVPFWVADEDVALFEEMDQLQVEVEKEQVDLSTTNKINLSTILEDTENDNMRFPTAAVPIEEDMKGDERNKKVKKLRIELNFDSERVPFWVADEDVALFEETPEMEQPFEEIEIEEASSKSSSNNVDERCYDKIPIAPGNKFIESSNAYQERNVSNFQSKTIAIVKEVEKPKKLNSKQHSERRMESPKGKDRISQFESSRMETKPMNEHFDLNSNSSSEFSGQQDTGKKFAKKRNFSSIFGNSFRNMGKYLSGSENVLKNYYNDAGSPWSDERANTNYDLSVEEMNCDDDDEKESLLIDKSLSFNIPSLEDSLMKSDDSMTEFINELRKPESKIGAGIKKHSQVKSDDESLASSLELTNPKRRRRNTEKASARVLGPTTKENLMTSQTTSVIDNSSKSIAEMRQIICTNWLEQNNFFKPNPNNWLATSNLPPISEFVVRIPDNTNRVLPMDDGGEENYHQLPDVDFSSSEY